MTDDPVEEHPPAQVTVARTVVEQLNAGVRWLVLMVVAFGLLFAYDAWQDGKKDHRQDTIDQHLVDSDIKLQRTAERLEELIASEDRQAKLDDARTCIQNHLRYGWLRELLSRIGKATDMSNAEVEDALGSFPAPACDLKAAQQVLADQ